MPVTDKLPFTVPGVAGVNVTLKAELWPGVKLVGSPLQLKPVPVMLGGSLRFVALFPVFVMAGLTLVLVPTLTLPKLMLEGVIESWRLTF